MGTDMATNDMRDVVDAMDDEVFDLYLSYFWARGSCGSVAPYSQKVLIDMLTHKGTQTIVTERLILRQFRYKDASAMYANWVCDEAVTRFLT